MSGTRDTKQGRVFILAFYLPDFPFWSYYCSSIDIGIHQLSVASLVFQGEECGESENVISSPARIFTPDNKEICSRWHKSQNGNNMETHHHHITKLLAVATSSRAFLVDGCIFMAMVIFSDACSMLCFWFYFFCFHFLSARELNFPVFFFFYVSTITSSEIGREQNSPASS